MKIDHEASLRDALTDQYCLFTGAGFSVCAKNSSGEPLPVGAELEPIIRKKFEIDHNHSLSLPQLYQIVNRTRPDELKALIKGEYKVASFDVRYKFIERIAPSTIITTNVDNIPHEALKTSNSHFLNDLYRAGASGARAAIDFIPVHGCVVDDSRPYVFAPFDIASATVADPDKWHLMRERLQRNPTLFWGYAFNDTGTLQAMRPTGPGGSSAQHGWVVVRPGTDTALYDYYRSMDLDVIVADTDEMLDYVSNLERDHVEVQAGAISGLENIPTFGSVAQRPAEDYFLGAPPAWSDILAGHLHKTGHYREVEDLLRAEKNVLLGGIPGCGKSTLLMQIGAFYATRKPKILYTGMGAREAEMLSRQIGSGSALVIIDAVANDIEVLNVFRRNSNIQILGADRDYALSSVFDLISTKDFEIIGVTGQSESDLASVWNTIPARLRRRQMQRLKPRYSLDPSLYEFVTKNLAEASLSERIVDHVKVLDNEAHDTAEFLILAAYLEYARSALSIDVALSYFRDENYIYDDVVAIQNELGDLVGYNPIASDQDYFVARSVILSEAILRGVPARLLAQVLQKFFTNVSPLRIPKFDAFRRRAYDASIFDRAFGDVNEGTRIYDQILSRDTGVAVMQQKALYLSKKRRFAEALAQIEEARAAMSRYTNWTLEGAYCRVLFEANKTLAADDLDAMQNCQRAISRLIECCQNDQRRGQNSITLGKCVLDIASIAPSEWVLPQAQAAISILEQVQIEEKFLSEPRKLLRDLKSLIIRLS